MSQFNLGWIPLIQQELRKFFASKAQGDLANTAIQPADLSASVFAISNGGTGGTTADEARGNLKIGEITNRNRLINGAMAIDQRNQGASQTIISGAALAYTIDRWYAYCTGANVVGQQIQGATAGQFNYRFTGAASVTSIGLGQRIEQANSVDLAGNTVTLSVKLSNSLLTAVTWTAYYANTANAFETLSSPTRTQIATGQFTVNSTLSQYSTSFSVPSAATTGIEIVFTVGGQTSGTWIIGQVQLEKGETSTLFERRSFGLETILCQRYFFKPNISQAISGVYGYRPSLPGSPTNQALNFYFPVKMRAIPTVGYSHLGYHSIGQNNVTLTDITGSPLIFVTQYGIGFGNEYNAINSIIVYAWGFFASAEL